MRSSRGDPCHGPQVRLGARAVAARRLDHRRVAEVGGDAPIERPQRCRVEIADHHAAAMRRRRRDGATVRATGRGGAPAVRPGRRRVRRLDVHVEQLELPRRRRARSQRDLRDARVAARQRQAPHRRGARAVRCPCRCSRGRLEHAVRQHAAPAPRLAPVTSPARRRRPRRSARPAPQRRPDPRAPFQRLAESTRSRAGTWSSAAIDGRLSETVRVSPRPPRSANLCAAPSSSVVGRTRTASSAPNLY